MHVYFQSGFSLSISKQLVPSVSTACDQLVSHFFAFLPIVSTCGRLVSYLFCFQVQFSFLSNVNSRKRFSSGKVSEDQNSQGFAKKNRRQQIGLERIIRMSSEVDFFVHIV